MVSAESAVSFSALAASSTQRMSKLSLSTILVTSRQMFTSLSTIQLTVHSQSQSQSMRLSRNSQSVKALTSGLLSQSVAALAHPSSHGRSSASMLSSSQQVSSVQRPRRMLKARSKRMVMMATLFLVLRRLSFPSHLLMRSNAHSFSVSTMKISSQRQSASPTLPAQQTALAQSLRHSTTPSESATAS